MGRLVLIARGRCRSRCPSWRWCRVGTLLVHAGSGAASLVVYLLHGFVVKLAEYSAFPDWSANHPVTSLVVAAIAAVAVALLLAAPPVASRLNAVVDPVGAWQRRRRRQATPAALPHGSHGGSIAARGMHSSARATSALGA